MINIKLFWKCPDCGEEVDFTKQLLEIFDEEDGEALFVSESGCWFHTISCKCGCDWFINISPVSRERKEWEKED